MVTPDGFIKGGWTGNFDIARGIDYQVMAAKLDGSIDAEKVFTDASGNEDYTKLFFMAKGNFTILENDDNSGLVRTISGYFYVRGWINPDKSASGDLTMTTDHREYRQLVWAAKPAKQPSLATSAGSFSPFRPVRR
ncbi:MAG: hypothetical protein PHF37_10490 [Phycisphaerae bacterium]|nr:hypothetical protein [Phycisphaerae bacterium]